MSLVEYNHLLDKAREVVLHGREAWEVQPPIDRLTVALIINEPMWIMEMGCSMAQAIDQIGLERCSILYAAEQALSREITSS